MTIRYKCEECGAALNINDELAGTEGSCPRCHVEFVVPSADGIPAKPAPAERPKSSGSLSTEDEIGDFLSSDEIPVTSGNTSLATSDDADSGASDNPFDDDAPRARKKSSANNDGDDELEARDKKKKGPLNESGKRPKRETADAASIAKSLMGKGGAVVEEDEEDEPDPGPKKKRRQFGAGSDRPEGEINSVKDVISYFVKMGWPALVGTVIIIGLCVLVYNSLVKKFDAPPLAKVSGTVTIDGKPVAMATIIQFIPVESAKNPKLGPSVGFTGENGKYSLQYTNELAGAVIGKHYVVIKPSDPGQGIPLRYGVTSDLQVEVASDGKPVDIALKSDPVTAE